MGLYIQSRTNVSLERQHLRMRKEEFTYSNMARSFANQSLRALLGALVTSAIPATEIVGWSRLSAGAARHRGSGLVTTLCFGHVNV